MAPHRSNRKGDLGNYRPKSSAADIDNIFFTEEGWVYRHFKGDPRDPKTRFWDEIIVAGQVDLDDTENGDPLETLSATPRHYLGLGATDESNSVDGYDADGIGYATEDIPFEEVFLPTGKTRVIGSTDKFFDVEYPLASDPGDGGDGGSTPGGGCTSDDDCQAGYICDQGICVPDPTAGCTNDRDCAPDEICLNGQCVPDPNIPECRTDDDCADDEICVNGNCEKAPDPILIDEVIVSALSGAAGTNPDLNETHEYIFNITGNAPDAQGIMRIEPTTAGTVVDNKVTWTDDVEAKVIFDVTSATAEDDPQPVSGELEINVKSPPQPADPQIGNVTITGPTDVTKGMEYEYTVSFDGDAKPDRCYVTNTTGVADNISGFDTSLGVYTWKGTIGIGAADNFELKLTVQCLDDVVEDNNNSEGTLDLVASDPSTTVSEVKYLYSNMYSPVPDGGEFAFNSGNPKPTRDDDGMIVPGNYAIVTFDGVSQEYGIPKFRDGSLLDADEPTIVFDRNEGNQDYWKVDVTFNGAGTRENPNVTVGGKTSQIYGRVRDVVVLDTLDAPKTPDIIGLKDRAATISDSDKERYEAVPPESYGYRYLGAQYKDSHRDFLMDNMELANYGAVYSIASKQQANYIGFKNNYTDKITEGWLYPKYEVRDYAAYFYLTCDNYDKLLPLSDISVTFNVDSSYSENQESSGTQQQTVTMYLGDLSIFEPHIDYDDETQVKPYSGTIALDDIKLNNSTGKYEFALYLDVDNDYEVKRDILDLDVSVDTSNSEFEFVNVDYEYNSRGPIANCTSDTLPSETSGTVEVTITYNSAQGRLTKTAILDSTHKWSDFEDAADGYADMGYTVPGLDYPQYYKDYLNT